MKRLARAFSRLTLAALIGLAALFVYERTRPPAPPPPLAPLEGRIDRILIEKSARRLTVFRDGAALRSYRIALGSAPAGAKTQQGDGKTPEGRFTIDRRNPNSAYHLSLGISYPRPQDIARARAAGVSPGGDIFIHGQPNGFGAVTLPHDWTAGCIAVSNAAIEELWRVTPTGTPVEIVP